MVESKNQKQQQSALAVLLLVVGVVVSLYGYNPSLIGMGPPQPMPAQCTTNTIGSSTANTIGSTTTQVEGSTTVTVTYYTASASYIVTCPQYIVAPVAQHVPFDSSVLVLGIVIILGSLLWLKQIRSA